MTSNSIEQSTLSPEFEAEFRRVLRELGNEEAPERYTIVGAEILRAHFLLAESFRELGEGLGGIGPRSTHLLQSAVSRQYVGFGGRQKWDDLYHLAATLFFGLIKNHPFHDANKRTALLIALYQLEMQQSCGECPAERI